MTDKGFCIEFIDEKPIGAVGKRFNYDYHDEKIIDNQTGKTYDKDNYHMLVIDGLLNQLNDENGQLKHQLQQQELEYATTCHRLAEENESLKEENKFLRNKVATYKKGNALLKSTMDKEWK